MYRLIYVNYMENQNKFTYIYIFLENTTTQPSKLRTSN